MRFLSFDIGVNNLAYCFIEDDSKKVIEWKVVNVIEGTKDFYDISEAFVHFLHEEFFDLDMSNTSILIENQPVLKNPVMKSIQMIVFTFFQMMKYQQYNDMSIRLISASNKLKCRNIPDGFQTVSGSTKYAVNKKKSILMCGNYIKEDETWKPYFDKHKKKDDLADCYLQAMYVIETASDKKK